MKTDTDNYAILIGLYLMIGLLVFLVGSIDYKQKNIEAFLTEIKDMKAQLNKLESDHLMEFEYPLDTKTQPSDFQKDYVEMMVEATGYANAEECCYPYFDGKTSTGRDANLPGVAVDPNVIPYGSYVEIDGFGKLLADDTGGKIKGNKIDIRFSTYEEAINWGRRNILIKVYIKN